VQIEDVVADRKSYELRSDLTLPALTRALEIDYTALSFAIPQRVQFRYKLEGHDKEWRDPGTRRQAFYNDLHPGSYTFRVVASNNDGLWNEQGATLAFSVAPAWYQTKWFRYSCVLAAVVLLWAIYQIRLQQLAKTFNLELEARVSERTRISRDLHDTLLQSFHGVLLRFQAASQLLFKRPTEAKTTLDSAIEEAAQAISQSREAIQGLRSLPVQSGDLGLAIQALGEEFAARVRAQNAVEFSVDVRGKTRDLNPAVRDEIYQIACEALRNAFRHSNGKRVVVQIQYEARELCLTVRDDGCGFDQTAGGSVHAGHFGLYAMSERARLVGGHLELWSEVGSGTQVELRVPASFAYTKSSGTLCSRFLGRSSRNRTSIGS
jgi:signal transduction histidine kinase